MEAMSTQQTVKELKVELHKQLHGRCPQSVCNGSMQVVVDFKRAWASGHRALNNDRSSLQAVRDAIALLRQFGE
jgi:hypothetical protein